MLECLGCSIYDIIGTVFCGLWNVLGRSLALRTLKVIRSSSEVNESVKKMNKTDNNRCLQAHGGCVNVES